MSLKGLGDMPNIERFIMQETSHNPAQIAIQQHKDAIRGIRCHVHCK